MDVLTPCVGRDDTLERLSRLVEANRWVTLTGAPGCGKTLVARHLAASRVGTRTVWVSANRQPNTDALVTACLDALGADLAPGEAPGLALKRALDEQPLLLVLDGVDRIDGLGAVLDTLVEDAEGFQLLCTATTVAGRPNETVLRLPPLPVPDASAPLEGPAVELLLARVAAAGGLPIDLAAQGATVRKLLAESGGLPFLIEQLAVQIALIGVSDVVPAGTLAEAVRGSYDLLDEDQQRCLRRLAVIEQPVGLDALADLWDLSRTEAVQQASALARRSLVEVQPDGRFDMLAPLREFGRHMAAASGDQPAAEAGLLRWVHRVIPQDLNSGAADEPWLAEIELVSAAITRACATDEGRPEGYALANRAFSSLYTAMRAREAVDLLEAVLDSGDGPPAIGSQLARRAGICASEVRGTYEGLRLLDRAEAHAAALDPASRELELARNAAIRAEMHLDAGNLDAARADAEVTLSHRQSDANVTRQARRTLMDVCVSRGDLAEAERLAPLILDSPPPDEQWMALSAHTLQARIAWEQGRLVEAASLAAFARDRGQATHEDRIALLADTVHRLVTGTGTIEVDPETLPWAVRLGVQLQQARDLLARGDVDQAAGLAADIVVLADTSKLGRDGVEARLFVAECLIALGEPSQARASYLSALRRASEIPMPLRAADALDGLAALQGEPGSTAYRQLTGAAAALRVSRRAVGRPVAGSPPVKGAVRDCPAGWLVGGHLSATAVAAAADLLAPQEPGDQAATPLGALTKAELAVSQLVAEGLTSRQIAEKLFVSPRTVDAHLSHIFRKLEIASRAKLAALMAEIA